MTTPQASPLRSTPEVKPTIDTPFEGTLRFLCRKSTDALMHPPASSDTLSPDAVIGKASRIFAVFAQLGSVARPDQKAKAWATAGEEAVQWIIAHPAIPANWIHKMDGQPRLVTEVKKKLAQEMARSLPTPKGFDDSSNFWGPLRLPGALAKAEDKTVDVEASGGLMDGWHQHGEFDQQNQRGGSSLAWLRDSGGRA